MTRAHDIPPPGIVPEGVASWLGARLDIIPPLRFTALRGGYSNLTYLVEDDANHRWVLRRPPLGNVLATAHDVSRESRIMSALSTSDVPVPEIIGTCDEPGVIGAPFFVMDFVDGLVVRDDTDASALSLADRRRAGLGLAEVLATLHATDIDEIGLGQLGRRGGYVERQLRRWHGQLHDSTTRDVSVFDEVHEQLISNVPEQTATSLIHGDYRIDNVILDEAHRVAAVLDWELATLGDPLADLGMTVAYWTEPDDGLGLPPAGTDAPGFPSRSDFSKRYAENTGFDVSDLPYFVALAHWKIACISEGVYARYDAGAMGETTDVDMDLLEQHPIARVEAAIKVLAEGL